MLYRRQPSVQVGFILIQAQASILKVLKERVWEATSYLKLILKRQQLSKLWAYIARVKTDGVRTSGSSEDLRLLCTRVATTGAY